MERRLYRSKKDRILAGVCGGLAAYGNVDSSVVRLVWTLAVLVTGIAPGIIIYILAIFIVPEEIPPAA